MATPRSLLSRADLIRAIGAEDEALFEYMVQQLALEKTALTAKSKQDSETADAANTQGHSAEHQATTTQENARLLDVPFWRVQQYEHTAQDSEDDSITPQAAVTEWSKRPETPPPYPEIAPWSTVNTKLRQHAATARAPNPGLLAFRYRLHTGFMAGRYGP